MVFLTKDANFNPDKYKHQETAIFGEREPCGYGVESFLGRGTVSLVWLIRSHDDQLYAAKQFPTINGANHPSADQEIEA